MNILEKNFKGSSPDVSIGRSRFKGLSHGHTLTADAGDLVPIALFPVYPGDTFSIDTSFLIRMATPVFPVMGNAYADIFWFYCPNRILWDHWPEFLGENTSAPWVQNIEYTIPQIKFGLQHSFESADPSVLYTTFGCRPGSVMNYLGVPTSTCPVRYYNAEENTFSVSDLPNRMYRLIWNEFFRSESVQYPVPVYTDDSSRNYQVYHNRSEDEPNYGDSPLKVNRFFDMFSGALPAPQCGNPLPVAVLGKDIAVQALVDKSDLVSDVAPLHFARKQGTGSWSSANIGNLSDIYASGTNEAKFSPVFTPPSSSTYDITPDNLYALTKGLTVGTVTELRQAFAIQRYEELIGRSGRRYRELLNAIFGVTVADSRVQVPEYLGGDRVPVNMDQVVQTSSSSDVSPQGNVAGVSLTTSVESSFTKSFVEHGYIMGLMAIRVEHTYSQYCNPEFFRKRRFDFYLPQFANLSEQPVLKKYFTPTGLPSYDEQVFGYNEAWHDLRDMPNQLSGGFSPMCVSSEDEEQNPIIIERESPLAVAWTYADWYQLGYNADDDALNLPTLSSEWLEEDPRNIGKTLAVSYAADNQVYDGKNQFLCDFYFKVDAVRPLPVRSIPGLIDHH